MRDIFWGLSVVRTKVFWDLYWGPLIQGNYHIRIRFRVRGFRLRVRVRFEI